MRLVVAPDGAVDRSDRSLWLTPPFDRAWLNPFLRRQPASEPILGWIGPAALAAGPLAGALGRAAMALGVLAGPAAGLLAQAPPVGISGRAGAGAAAVGRLERERLASGPTAGSF